MVNLCYIARLTLDSTGLTLNSNLCTGLTLDSKLCLEAKLNLGYNIYKSKPLVSKVNLDLSMRLTFVSKDNLG